MGSEFLIMISISKQDVIQAVETPYKFWGYSLGLNEMILLASKQQNEIYRFSSNKLYPIKHNSILDEIDDAPNKTPNRKILLIDYINIRHNITIRLNEWMNLKYD